VGPGQCMPWAVALAIGVQLADGLRYLHEREILHRDIKGSNVILCRDGRVQLLDFGLARTVDATALTQEGAIVGTVLVMAPEVLLGAAASAASDLWSLGCLMYRLLTGENHLDFTTPQGLIQGILNTHILAPAMRVPSCPKPVSDAVMECLSISPEDRPSSAKAFHAHLLDLCQIFKVGSPEQTLQTRIQKVLNRAVAPLSPTSITSSGQCGLEVSRPRPTRFWSARRAVAPAGLALILTLYWALRPPVVAPVITRRSPVMASPTREETIPRDEMLQSLHTRFLQAPESKLAWALFDRSCRVGDLDWVDEKVLRHLPEFLRAPNVLSYLRGDLHRSLFFVKDDRNEDQAQLDRAVASDDPTLLRLELARLLEIENFPRVIQLLKRRPLRGDADAPLVPVFVSEIVGHIPELWDMEMLGSVLAKGDRRQTWFVWSGLAGLEPSSNEAQRGRCWAFLEGRFPRLPDRELACALRESRWGRIANSLTHLTKAAQMVGSGELPRWGLGEVLARPFWMEAMGQRQPEDLLARVSAFIKTGSRDWVDEYLGMVLKREFRAAAQIAQNTLVKNPGNALAILSIAWWQKASGNSAGLSRWTKMARAAVRYASTQLWILRELDVLEGRKAGPTQPGR
jgi:hypothetical protein